MSLDVKLFLALAPICFGGMTYALFQGDWWTAGSFALLQGVMVVLYRAEKRRLDQGSEET